METMWFYLFWAAVAALFVAVAGLLVLAWRCREAERYGVPAGKEMFLSYQQPDFENVAGFCVDCPQSDLLTPTAYWLVDDRVAQIVYDLAPAQQVTLRAALQSEAGVPCAEANRERSYDSDEVCTVDGVQVRLKQTNSGAASASWRRDGVEYLLYGEGLQMNAIGGLLPLFIARTRVRRQAQNA